MIVRALLGLALVAALAGVAWLLLRARRATRARKPPRKRRPARVVPRHPVVLAHGLFGFDELPLPGGRVEYWKGIPRALRKMGADVVVPRCDPTASVSTRSRQLAEVLRSVSGAKVNVLAHSMGGVDARVAIARLGVADRVASLVTIGTPHRGTPLASLGTAALGPVAGKRRRALPKATAKADGGAPRARRRSLDLGGVRDARPDAMKRLNRHIRDDARVLYASVVSGVDSARAVHPLLVPGYLYLSGTSGRNDGVVPAASQAWGEVLASVEVDHWAIVGWSKRFDAPDFYARLLRELAARGC